ncbi:MAG: hypothetical protein KGL39_02415 [Patescibacteria group bacterium]|nr:hypothetical protein [Patescibacteria group bacterium]
MAAKLRSLPTNPALRLAFSALIWALLAWWARGSEFSLWPLLILLGVSGWLYFHPPLFLERFAYSFLAIFFLIFLTPNLGAWDWLASLFGGLVVFLMLGVKNLHFLNRHAFHLLAHSLLIVWFSLLLFHGSLGSLSLFWFFLWIWLLLREYLVSRNRNDESSTPLINAAAAVGALVATELAWTVSLLPIGFIEEAALFSALFFLAEDVMYYAINGALDQRTAIRNSVLAVLMSAMVFLTSSWTPH